MLKPIVEMRGIVKRFPGVTASDHVDLDLYPGEIHALLGENGSGKSTLMSILTGFYRPDGGTIRVRDQEYVFQAPRDAIIQGIGMVHQHFKLVEPFTVAENIIMSQRDGGLILSVKEMKEELAGLNQRYGLDVCPEAKVWQLSVGEKQRVEIVRMLYHGSRVLILDEPTAVLTPSEARELFQNLRKMAADGCAVVLITHKLHEVMAVADRVTVLRLGKVTGVLEKNALSERELIRLMVGQEMKGIQKETGVTVGNPVLKMERVTAQNDMGLSGLEDVSLTLHEGEIFGIAGVAGNGQRELAEVIAGLRPILQGQIEMDACDAAKDTHLEWMQRGIGYVPADRLGMGLVPDMTVEENLMLKCYRQPEFSGRWLLKGKPMRERALELVEKYKVKTTGLQQPVKMLSGGHLQRLLLAREIAENPRVMVVEYPARGLDIAATEAVHQLLLGLKQKGTAILLISEDLEEIMKMADRIGVLCTGKIAGIFPAEEADLEVIGALMTGCAESQKGEQTCGCD